MGAKHFDAGSRGWKTRSCSPGAVNTAESAIDAVVAGVGVTRVLSYQAVDAVRAGTLTLVLRAFEPVAAPVNLVHAGQGLLPLKLQAFIDFAAPRPKA